MYVCQSLVILDLDWISQGRVKKLIQLEGDKGS